MDRIEFPARLIFSARKEKVLEKVLFALAFYVYVTIDGKFSRLVVIFVVISIASYSKTTSDATFHREKISILFVRNSHEIVFYIGTGRDINLERCTRWSVTIYAVGSGDKSSADPM